MSYCRFSSDNFDCDLYCYESKYGFEIHVASRRCIIDRSQLKPISHESPIQDIIDNGKILHDLLSNCKYEDIDLPYAGLSFTEATEHDMFKRILQLHELGYHVPNDLLIEIEETS